MLTKRTSRKSRRQKIKEPRQQVSISKHPWRLCPAGQHYRRGTRIKAYIKPDGTHVDAHFRKSTCANNPSNRDQLYPEEINEIAKKHFEQFKKTPLNTLPGFEKNGNNYDHFIQGWTKYWNDVLEPSVPLDLTTVKALIASESSFNPSAWNKINGPGRARGLMQVTDKTVQYLKDIYKELKDHFLNLKEDDMLDPNLSICAGIRWLFRKKEIAEARSRKTLDWRDAVAEYKGIKPNNKLMGKFDKYYKELTGVL